MNSTAFSGRSPPHRTPRIVVVGAGMGGLVAALELAVAGLAVTLCDKADGPGGKMREVVVAGRPIDAGPTVLTMRWVFDAIFARARTSLGSHLVLRAAETLARHAWSPSEQLDLFADKSRSADAIAALAGPEEGRRYLAFCERAETIFRALETSYIEAHRPSPFALARRLGLTPRLFALSPFETLWHALDTSFRDPRLRQLFGRYATYCGASPFSAPATLMLVAHVEREGVWLVDGGMRALALALARVAEAHGARLRFGSAARRIRLAEGRAAAVELGSGEVIAADAVVWAGDVAALGGGLLGDEMRGAAPSVPHRQRSLSAVTIAQVAQTQGFALHRHNVFFGPDYRSEFRDVFDRGRLPAAPTVYVCAQDRDATGALQVPGPERLFCIVNAPPTGDTGGLGEAEIAACEERTFGRLAACGLTIQQPSEPSLRTGPRDFDRLFPGSGGALYGRASHGWTASFRRPGARSRVPGLYLAGGSVHPGPGVPMAALSGQRAAEAVLDDLLSMRRSSRAAMSGGMSTA